MDIASPSTLAIAKDHLRRSDPILSAVIDTVQRPIALSPHTNYYQELVESIISQQLSVKAADSIMKRFLALFSNEGGDDAFPSPSMILMKSADELRGVGLSYQKARYIQDLALKVIDGTVRFDHLDTATNDEVIAELTQIKGVGVWTVHMFLMFCMGRLDVLPTGDLGIKNGIRILYGLPAQPNESDIIDIAHRHHWHPYESVASWYVWQSLNNTPALS